MNIVLGVLLLVMLVLLLAACGGIGTPTPVQTVDPNTVREVMPPPWAWPVNQWLNMDWDLWSCPRARGC